MLVPAVTGPLHVAVLGAGESFRLYAQSAPLELLQVSMPAAGGSVKLAGLARVGFAAWYRVDNNIEVPDRGLSQHTFEVQVWRH